MLSAKKRLEIANICYANVAGEFAMFNNPKFRGPKFTWERWIEHCEDAAEGWMFINDVSGDMKQIVALAREYAKEIAERLVGYLTE
jgi:hypothetical protein